MGFSEEERNTIIGALREWEQKYVADMNEGRRVLLRTARVLTSRSQIDCLCRRIAERALQCTRITEGG
jgi:hypothetical protein